MHHTELFPSLLSVGLVESVRDEITLRNATVLCGTLMISPISLPVRSPGRDAASDAPFDCPVRIWEKKKRKRKERRLMLMNEEDGGSFFLSFFPVTVSCAGTERGWWKMKKT